MDAINPHTARAILSACATPIGADFHALPSARVTALGEYAAKYKYREPRDANGSRVRYFHELLQRRAKR